MEDWNKVILPRRGLLDIPWRELGRYRDLIWLMAARNLTAQYKQTVLGPSWFVIQPLLTTLVFSFLFGRVAGLGTDGVPHFLFYMSGLVMFGYMADCVNKTAVTFTKNAQLFGKVYFPRLVVPISQAMSSLAGFAVQFGIFLIGLGFYLVKAKWFADPTHPIHIDPNWRMALFPVFIVQTAMLGVGTGLIVAALTTRYRDLLMGVGFGVQLWMFASSVAFPLSRVTNATQVMLLKLNPMVPIIEAVRFAFLGEGTVTKQDLLVSFGTCAAVFLVGLLMFTRAERTVMDTV
jgi:lipopolysaccharide transport system permease protein